RRLVAVSQVKIHVTVGATAEPAAAFRVAAADGDGQRRSVRRHLDGFVLPLLRVDVRIVPVLAHVGTGLDHAHRAAFVLDLVLVEVRRIAQVGRRRLGNEEGLGLVAQVGRGAARQVGVGVHLVVVGAAGVAAVVCLLPGLVGGVRVVIQRVVDVGLVPDVV